MENGYDPLSETTEDLIPAESPEDLFLITVDDFYDLLMEQQEQM